MGRHTHVPERHFSMRTVWLGCRGCRADIGLTELDADVDRSPERAIKHHRPQHDRETIPTHGQYYPRGTVFQGLSSHKWLRVIDAPLNRWGRTLEEVAR